MSAAKSVVVVGAGVAGLSAAMHAARMGATVTVLERSTLSAGSSGLSAGIFNRQTFDPVDLAFRVESGRQLAEIEAETSFRVTRAGYMRLARSQDAWDRVLATIGSGDYPDTRLLSPDEVAAMVPGMRVDDVFGAMYGAGDGHMDGPELCAAYLELGRRHGVEYRPDTEVLGAEHGPAGLRIETSGGTIAADVAINAAGSWFAEVGDRVGAPVPVDNQLHEIAMLSVPSLADRDVPTVQTYFPGSGEDAVYVRPEGRGRFLAGLHSYESHAASAAPGSSSRQLSEGYLEQLVEALMDRFPGWDDAGLDSGWSGIYPLSPDGRFVIGPDAADPRVIALGGLGGVGLTVSPAAGLLAAQWAVTGRADLFDFAGELLPSRFGGAA
jgi:sarcosine oxidase subunit beta